MAEENDDADQNPDFFFFFFNIGGLEKAQVLHQNST